jgi:hypothetical protein
MLLLTDFETRFSATHQPKQANHHLAIPGMGHTDLRDVQYGKVRNKYALNTQYAYNRVPYLMQFGSADF